MKQARKIIVSESIVYEVGQKLSDRVTVTRIDVPYPLAKVFTTQDSTKPAIEIFLNPWSVVEWSQA